MSRHKEALILVFLSVLLLGVSILIIREATDKPVLIFCEQRDISEVLSRKVCVFEDGTCKCIWTVPRWMNKKTHSAILPIETSSVFINNLANRLTFSYKHISVTISMDPDELSELFDLADHVISMDQDGDQDYRKEEMYCMLKYRTCIIKCTERNLPNYPHMQSLRSFLNRKIPDEVFQKWYYGV